LWTPFVDTHRPGREARGKLKNTANGEWKKTANGEWRIANGREAVGAQRRCALGRDSLLHEQIAGSSLPHLLTVPQVWEYGRAVCTEERMGKRGVVRGLALPRSWQRELGLSGAPSASAPRPGLPNHVRLARRARHDSLLTEQAYVAWIERVMCFHGVRHPAEMGAQEIRQFSSDLNDDLHPCSEPGAAVAFAAR
jgi:hypothetical protein